MSYNSYNYKRPVEETGGASRVSFLTFTQKKILVTTMFILADEELGYNNYKCGIVYQENQCILVAFFSLVDNTSLHICVLLIVVMKSVVCTRIQIF